MVLVLCYQSLNGGYRRGVLHGRRPLFGCHGGDLFPCSPKRSYDNDHNLCSLPGNYGSETRPYSFGHYIPYY